MLIDDVINWVRILRRRRAKGQSSMNLMALLLDLANIVGGFLLAIAVLRLLPRVGDDLARFAARMGPFGWIVGVVALVAGGFYVIVHLLDGPGLLHFEVVGIGVGLALLWDRLTGRRRAAEAEPPTATAPGSVTTRSTTTASATVTGAALLLAIFGLIAIAVGIQGLFTPD
jgi:hypothetical protein